MPAKFCDLHPYSAFALCPLDLPPAKPYHPLGPAGVCGQRAATDGARGMRKSRDFITVHKAADMIGVSPATLGGAHP
jgi:hypothetical protein